MSAQKLLLLPGDGIGPEVMAEVKRLIAWMNDRKLGRFELEEGLVGGSSYDASGTAVTEEHARLLKRYADHAIIVLDADAAGQKAALRSAELLIAEGMAVSLAALPLAYLVFSLTTRITSCALLKNPSMRTTSLG